MFEHRLINLPAIRQENGKWARHYVSEELGIRLPSITTVLSKTKDQTFLNEWKAKVGEAEAQRIVKRATTRGSIMHSLCEDLVKNAEVRETDNEIAKMLYKPLKMHLSEHVNSIRGIESGVFSTVLGIAGTTDLVAEYDGELAIIDYKSSDKIKRAEWLEDYWLQGAFYFKALHEMTGLMPKKVVILMAVEEHVDWRGEEQPCQVIPYIHRGREIIEDIEKLRVRKVRYDTMFPPAPRKVL